MRQYETFELCFQGEMLIENYGDIPLYAEFYCGEYHKTVMGFYDGDGRYLIRYLPETAGEYRWRVYGMIEAEGHEICEASDGHVHGIVKTAGTHFVHADGTDFVPFGTTVYALAHQEDAVVNETLDSLKTAPFNKIRMCVFPKHYVYNNNEPPFYAFEKNEDGKWDTGRPCIAFWHRFEDILDRINAMGIQIDLILFHSYDRWGFDSFTQQDNLLYLDYLLRRLSAKPGIWWSLANEYELCRSKTLDDWKEIEAFVAEKDPYGHLLSNHNCFCFWDVSRPEVTHASIQTKALTEVSRWVQRYQKPVIIDECGYEGNIPQLWGSISGREMVNRFWRCYISGGYCTHGETFLADDEVLWWARGGKLKGESPERIAFLRCLLESLPGTLTPMENGIGQLADMDDGQIDVVIQQIPEETKSFVMPFIRSIQRMEPADRAVHLAGEHEWSAHIGEEFYLWFYDQQCFAEQTLPLPEGKTYLIEQIDVWEMTRAVIRQKASGRTMIHLPGKEGIAVLASRIADI